MKREKKEKRKKRNNLSRGRRNVHVPEVRAGRASLPRAFPVERLIAALLPLSLTRHLLSDRRRISLPFPILPSPPPLFAVFRRRRFPLVFPFTEREDRKKKQIVTGISRVFGHG